MRNPPAIVTKTALFLLPSDLRLGTPPMAIDASSRRSRNKNQGVRPHPPLFLSQGRPVAHKGNDGRRKHNNRPPQGRISVTRMQASARRWPCCPPENCAARAWSSNLSAPCGAVSTREKTQRFTKRKGETCKGRVGQLPMYQAKPKSFLSFADWAGGSLKLVFSTLLFAVQSFFSLSPSGLFSFATPDSRLLLPPPVPHPPALVARRLSGWPASSAN